MTSRMNRYPGTGPALRLISLAAIALLLAASAAPSGAAPAAESNIRATPASKAAKPAAKPASKVKAAKADSKAAPKAATASSVPLPRPRPSENAAVAPTAPAAPTASSSPAPPLPSGDLAVLKQAVDLVRRGKASEAYALSRNLQDRAAAKLVEWVILRSDYADGVSFERYIAFITENPTWPSLGLFRRRAEASLFHDRREASTVRAFFAHQKPVSAKGRLALARAFVAQGDPMAAEPYVRQAWRSDSFSADVEAVALSGFGDMLTRADHKARMDRLLYDDEFEAAMRAAQRLGPTEIAIAKARTAMNKKAANAKALLDAVPAEARRDPGYMFNQIQWLRRSDKIAEAGQLMLTVPSDPAVLHDLDQWWMERRYLARKLLDIGDPQTAYRVARDAAPPPRENYKVDHNFTAGWIALRFLKDPATALAHFARIPVGIGSNPHALARADYWQGRALEALGRHEEARRRYEAAAKHSTVYYGQIARGRLGLPDLPLNAPPRPPAVRSDVVRAAEMLYAIDERELAAIVMADLGERGNDLGILAALGEVTARYGDARGMLLLGKGALGRGYAFDYYAYPMVGLPNYKPVGPPIEPSIAYSIARTESGFNQKVVSTANALGLMQVTPAAGRYIAKKFSAPYDQKRLQTDPIYNMQMGAAELGDLIQYYRGSYILTFAGYNAGRGRVKEWIDRYGDPRDPDVDPIDWVERIPFAETRNYVQRIVENLQVYRVRFGGGSRLLIEADLRRGTSTN